MAGYALVWGFFLLLAIAFVILVAIQFVRQTIAKGRVAAPSRAVFVKGGRRSASSKRAGSRRKSRPR